MNKDDTHGARDIAGAPRNGAGDRPGPTIRRVKHRDSDESPHWEEVERQNTEVNRAIRNALYREDPLQRTLARAAHRLTRPRFLIGELIFFLGWFILNTGLIRGIRPWDPYPFTFLTGIASVQAFFIGILVLMYTERNERHNDIREQIDLKQQLHGEQEIAKVLSLLCDIHEALQIEGTKEDKNLAEMIKPLDVKNLERGTGETATEPL